jgi:hypothetical protein
MAKRKAAHLDGALLARKGEAVPVGVRSAPAQTIKPTGDIAIPKGTTGTIAVTVRLDPDRYRRLVSYGARFVPRRTNQEILIAALDEYLAKVE